MQANQFDQVMEALKQQISTVDQDLEGLDQRSIAAQEKMKVFFCRAKNRDMTPETAGLPQQQ